MSPSPAAAPPPLDNAAMAAALAVLTAGVDALAEVEGWRLGERDLLTVARTLRVLTGRVEAQRLRLLAEADQRAAAAGVGATSTTGWLRAATRRRAGHAHRDVRLAAALAQRYTATGAALAAGQVDVEQAEVIRDCLDRLPTTLPLELRAEAEAELLTRAGSYDATLLARLGRHLQLALDPDGPADLQRAEDRAVAARELSLTPLDDGSMRVRGQLDAEGGAALLAALQPLAAPRPTTADGPDLRSPARRRADALLHLVQLAASSPAMPTSGGAVPALTLTLSYDALRAQLAATVDTGAPLTPASVRRLACDAGLIPALLGSDSQPLDVGRATRTIPPAIRRALTLRDQHCVFPGCDRPPPWCDGHHIVHWADGGPTSLANLALLCGHHHRLIHADHGWTITGDPTGRAPTIHPPPWIAAAA